jgi:NAD(P)-dependent dehydrogenase (short-subunit alcohol dehydrogenase family)
MTDSFDFRTAYDLTGRVAIVTGGSRGIGAAIAWGLARAGAHVVVASRRLAPCAELADQLQEATGVECLPYAVHVGHWDELEGLVEAAHAHFGRLDVLVNNAGMSPLYDSPSQISEELFDKVMAVNLKGPMRLAILAGERMRSAGSGSIVNISSAGSVRPRPHILPYAAAKAGLNAATIGLAHALGPQVRVNAIVVGTIMTDVSASWDPAAFAQRAQGFALRRGGQPNEIVGAALYLASDASTYTTGSLLTVDGGQP